MSSPHNYVDHAKIVFDYLKHFTTVCTGAIAVIAALVSKAIGLAEMRWAAAGAVIACGLCILAATFAYTIVIGEYRDIAKREQVGLSSSFMGAIMATWIAFLVAIVFLVIFAAGNALSAIPATPPVAR